LNKEGADKNKELEQLQKLLEQLQEQAAMRDFVLANLDEKANKVGLKYHMPAKIQVIHLCLGETKSISISCGYIREYVPTYTVYEIKLTVNSFFTFYFTFTI